MSARNHLYLLNTELLNRKEVFDHWYSRMPPGRKEKIDRFRFDKDKQLSLGAGILLQEGLGRSGIPDIQLSYGAFEKPFLTDRDDIHFNLSHSGTVAACAISDRTIGVDVERDQQFKDTLIRYIYLDSEIQYIYGHHTDHDKAFTELWTIKESIMKYFGTGISLAPKKICVDLHEPVHAHCEGYSCEDIYFTRYVTDGYHITVCSEYKNFPERPEWIVP